jgi:hypothetical protein
MAANVYIFIFVYYNICIKKNACLPLQKIINPLLFSFKNCLIDSIIIDDSDSNNFFPNINNKKSNYNIKHAFYIFLKENEI